jgi:DNA-directed RNA polymerase specialized sigma24 family protein
MLVDFHSLFGRYSQDVYRFALYLSGDPSLAEEITQETFVRAWVMPGEVRAGTVVLVQREWDKRGCSLS